MCHQTIGHHCEAEDVCGMVRRVDAGKLSFCSGDRHLYEHMYTGKVFPTCHSVADTVMGYDKLFRLVGDRSRIIPGHDPEVMHRYPAYTSQSADIAVKLDADEVVAS